MDQITGEDADYQQRDLYDAIEREWSVIPITISQRTRFS